jgi:hypothetical protein
MYNGTKNRKLEIVKINGETIRFRIIDSDSDVESFVIIKDKKLATKLFGE